MDTDSSVVVTRGKGGGRLIHVTEDGWTSGSRHTVQSQVFYQRNVHLKPV